MSDLALARRYAKAFFHEARKAGEAEALQSEMNVFAGLLDEAVELRVVFTNPAITHEARKKVLGAVLDKSGCKAVTRKLLTYLLEKDRLLLVGAIAVILREMLDEVSGRRQAIVISAVPLDEQTVAMIEAQLTAVSGGQAEIVREVDPSLVGGLVVKIGGTVYDGSMRYQLDRLKTAMARG